MFFTDDINRLRWHHTSSFGSRSDNIPRKLTSVPFNCWSQDRFRNFDARSLNYHIKMKVVQLQPQMHAWVGLEIET